MDDPHPNCQGAATGAGMEAEEMMVVAPIKADYSEARW